jgi:hypothetical protein
MVKQDQENLIQSKVMKKKEFYRCAFKIYSKEKKLKIVRMDLQHQSELHIYKYTIKNLGI